MKTEKQIRVGDMLLVLRSDGGVYIGRARNTSAGIISDPFRIGSSAAICNALATGLLEMEQHIRATPNQPKEGP